MPTDAPLSLIRLNKALARAGICSRRAADELIVQGKVFVNEVCVQTPGVRINPDQDRLRVAGREVPLAREEGADILYVALHKPEGVVTTASDPQGRQTVLDLLPEELRRRRPFPVGRLDLLSTGLLMLTTDGELALRMTHPRWEHPKTYHVLVRGRVTRRKLEIMRQGMRLAEGELLAPVHARILRHVPPHPGCVTLELILRQGVNRQIRRMCRDLHLHIHALHRVAQGPIRLGNLPPGAWRALAPHEISALRDSLVSQEKSP